MATEQNEYLKQTIINQIKEFGASSAGIARNEDLKTSPSYIKYDQDPYHEIFDGFPDWPEDSKSILVFAFVHKRSERELDWKDPKPGGTPGNRVLIQIQKNMKRWLIEEMNINAHSIQYRIETGGIFLKDTSVLGGIGIIGKNNLLLIPEYGPCVRLRAIFLDKEFEPTGPLDFDPCTTCDKPCFIACPQNAFRNGFYERKYCKIQIRKDEADLQPLPNDPKTEHIRYCRACELSCPVAI